MAVLLIQWKLNIRNVSYPIIKEWDLQAISKYVREAAEFVNLYSNGEALTVFLH